MNETELINNNNNNNTKSINENITENVQNYQKQSLTQPSSTQLSSSFQFQPNSQSREQEQEQEQQTLLKSFKITASEVATVCGLSKYSLPKSLWQAKLQQLPSNQATVQNCFLFYFYFFIFYFNFLFVF
jgi:hypothetical protein